MGHWLDRAVTPHIGFRRILLVRASSAEDGYLNRNQPLSLDDRNRSKWPKRPEN